MLKIITFLLTVNAAFAKLYDTDNSRVSRLVHPIEAGHELTQLDSDTKTYSSSEGLKISQVAATEENTVTSTRDPVDVRKIKGRRRGSGGNLKGAGTGAATSRGASLRQIESRYLAEPVSYPGDESTWLEDFWSDLLSPNFE